MNHALIGLQILLLVAALPLLATSLRTSRSHRTRHSGFMAVGALLALLALIVSLLSVASSADDRQFDYAMSFTPPVFTIGLCAWVIWRAIGASNRPQGDRAIGSSPRH